MTTDNICFYLQNRLMLFGYFSKNWAIFFQIIWSPWMLAKKVKETYNLAPGNYRPDEVPSGCSRATPICSGGGPFREEGDSAI
jgi:hypothetical protein